jgi:hypothetical protein
MLAASEGHRQDVSDEHAVTTPEVRIDDSGDGDDLCASLLNR